MNKISHRISPGGGSVWRADLVRSHLAFPSPVALDSVAFYCASMLGFDWVPSMDQTPSGDEGNASKHHPGHVGRTREDFADTDFQKDDAPSFTHYWLPTVFRPRPWPSPLDEDLGHGDEVSEIPKPHKESISDAKRPSAAPLPFHPLATESQLRTRLEPLLSKSTATRRVDVPRLVEQVVRGESIRTIPCVVRKRPPDPLVVLADRSERCIPFYGDQSFVGQLLIRLLGEERFDPWVTRSATLFSRSTNAFRIQSLDGPSLMCDAWIESLSGTTSVLILGDLGVLERNPRSVDLQRWLRTLRRLRDNGITPYALVPFSTDRLPKALSDTVTAIGWQGNAGSDSSDAARAQLVHELFVRLYPAMQIEPELLREVRLGLPAAGDGSLESEFWQHPWLSSVHESCALCDDRNVKDKLESEFERLADSARSFVLARQRHFRMTTHYDWLWLLEFLNLKQRSQRLVKEYARDRRAMAEQILAYAGNAKAQTIPDDDEDRVVWISKRFSEAALWDQEVRVGSSVRLLQRLYQSDLVHASTRAREIDSDGKPRQLQLTWGEDGIHGKRVGTDDEEPTAPDRSVVLPATSKLIEVTVRTVDSTSPHYEREKAFWKSGTKPQWVSDYGTDEYGAWCEFQVPRHEGEGMVTQRLRWIPPGKFMMGSQKSHLATLTRGYWLADSPVTQELWMAIDRKKNPSRFEGPTLPVERVSWEDCQGWLRTLNEVHGSLSARFPTEAEWEYACRAGSTTAYCFGDDEQELPKYAWVGNNSKGKTHAVKELLPNGWGLHDMHGNVWEWCSDWWGDYASKQAIDPTGPETGSNRVVRGGSWISGASGVRSAYRDANGPGGRNEILGFRLLSSGDGAEPSEGAITPAAEPGVERGSMGSAPATPRAVRRDRFWKSSTAPDWVSDYGKDTYGLWCEFQVPRYKGDGMVTQRLRWIPPGEFMMGSPESEEGRYEDEGPQHLVKLTRGYWLADSPVTQTLWMAIDRKKNPSRFEGPTLPVERVSWEDCQGWLRTLNEVHGSLSARFPTEAEWEYACRAGSTTAYCFGDDEQELPKYAWFGNNSKGKTHAVKELLPNGWGLYDMHGNVWEWCSDWWGDYASKQAIDPTGPETGSSRVVRGGGWIYAASYVRSAYRVAVDPGSRIGSLGFRLALGSVPGAEPSEGATPPAAEPGVERESMGSAQREYVFVRSLDLDDRSSRALEAGFAALDFESLDSVRVISDTAGYQFDRLSRPAWAVDFGCDEYGLYATFEVQPIASPSSKSSRSRRRSKKPVEPPTAVRQRLRWIPPGRFQMGSPENEAGRAENETQHWVDLTHGYWMFDTPCTQALWECVMGANPSYFVDPERPVEQVSWGDVGKFVSGLNSQLPRDIQFRLPTEAEWEYACRAGTTTATYEENLDLIEGTKNAPVLDAIAWYGGNSGHAYDLETSIEVTWHKNRQYPSRLGGTRKVMRKAPNGWGLYDMLGNVWEWCLDWHDEYPTAEQTDPIGPRGGKQRVIRGGSWRTPAQRVRSACRYAYRPSSRFGSLGFRLVSSAFDPKIR